MPGGNPALLGGSQSSPDGTSYLSFPAAAFQDAPSSWKSESGPEVD